MLRDFLSFFSFNTVFPRCVGVVCVCVLTHAPLSTLRERTVSKPNSITLQHSEVNSWRRPWKHSSSKTMICRENEGVRADADMAASTIECVYLCGGEKNPGNRCFRLTFQWPENLVQWCVILSEKVEHSKNMVKWEQSLRHKSNTDSDKKRSTNQNLQHWT